jgi:hypothetical protein
LPGPLNFERQLAGTDHGRVQRAIKIVLGRGDVVVELARNVRPQSVHDTQHGVAIGDGGDQHAHRSNIVELIERQLLALHFAPDAVDVLWPAGDLALDVCLRQFRAQQLDHFADVAFTSGALGGEPARDALVILRVEIAEAQVFQLPFELPHTKSIRERRVDLARFVRQALAFRLWRVLAIA